jgi:RHS repeat-associated protein
LTVVAETDLAGTLKSEYVFFDGERVARRDGATGTGGVFYYFSDHLKTASIITDSAGTIKAESDYYPWGGELQFVNNDSNDYKFTGKKRDTETGLDYFGARYYSNGLGRWVSADWDATPVPVPYADFNDPQTLNLYQFVGGNPASKSDPDGHGVLDLLLKTVGLAGDAATVVDSSKTIVDSKAPVGDRVGASLNLASVVFPALAVQKVNPSEVQANLQNSLETLGIKRSGPVEPLAGTPATEPYKRPSNATTPEQRASVQGKPCTECGKTEDTMRANHKDALVEQHYRDGSVNTATMHDVNAVGPHCTTCSARQGGFLSAFSKKMKEVLKSIRESKIRE